MRKIIFSIPITLDGYIEGPHRELNWVVAYDELHDYAAQLLESGDLLIYGRVTYELMASYWPKTPSDPNATESMKRFANTLNPMRKIVYSKTLANVGWNTQVKQTFNPKEIQAMKTQPGGNILLSGGASMAQEFINQHLVDEYQLVVQPVVIGEGKSLFKGITDMQKLDFQWSRKFTSGAVALCYRVEGIT